MSLTRESILNGLFDQIRRDAGPEYLAERRSPEEFRRTREDILARKPKGSDVWIFGYGSLMWNPAILFAEARPARIHGYHRSYCLWSPFGRGTPDNPGLMLALKPGGSVLGMAYRLSEEQADQEMEIIWKREMSSGAYSAHWLRTQTGEGPVWSISFVINPEHPRYICSMEQGEMAKRIAAATGKNGSCREYLERTVAHLREIGQTDGPMHRLLQQIESLETA